MNERTKISENAIVRVKYLSAPSKLENEDNPNVIVELGGVLAVNPLFYAAELKQETVLLSIDFEVPRNQFELIPAAD